LIGNEWRSTAKPTLSQSRHEERLAEVADAGEAEIDGAVQAARACLDSREWRELPARKRGQLLYRIAELLEQRSPEIAEVETKNNGKPLFESKIDVAMAVETFRYYGAGPTAHGRHATRERQFLHLHAARAGGCSGRDRA